MRKRKRHRFAIVLCLILPVLALLSFKATQFLQRPEASADDRVIVQPAPPETVQSPYTPVDTVSTPSVSAACAVLYDMHRDTLLYEKNSTQPCYPGSLTKLLTVLTACTWQGDAISYAVGDEIDLIGYNSSIAYLRKGDILSFEAIVDAVMLSSGNDATYTLAVNLARHLGGDHLSDVEALTYFAGLLNETALSIGCTDSSFISVDGYPDPQHYSTPLDLLRIAIAASNNETIAKSMAKSRAYHVFQSGRDVVWETTNKLLQKDGSYQYAYATGMKTGSTSDSDYSLAASAEKDGTALIAIVVGTPSDGARFSDAITLFESVFSAE